MASVIERLLGRSEARALTRENVPQAMLGTATVAGVTLNEKTALGQADILGCVRLLAESASILPLVAFRRVQGGRQRLRTGRLAGLLDRPAPGVTGPSLVGQLVTCLSLRGNAWVGKFRNAEGEIEQLGVLPPERVQVEVKGGLPLYTVTHVNGRVTTHEPSDIVHIRMPVSIDGVLGASPIQLAREALGLNRALGLEASALIANASAPRGVLSVSSGPASDDLMSNLERDFSARHQGPEKAGRVAVLTSDVTFTALSISPHDAEFVAQRKLSTQEVCRIFRCPPHLVAAEGGSSMTYSNLEMEGAYFLTFTLSPYLVAIESALSADDLCPGPNVYVQFLTQALLRADAQARAAFYSAGLDPVTGWLRREEVRRFEDLDPEPEQAAVSEAA